MKVTSFLERIGRIGSTTADIQSNISILEAGNLLDMLVARYDVLETTQVLENYAKDTDLKVILSTGKSILEGQINTLERELVRYGVPMTRKPPEFSKSTLQAEILTDRYIFRRLFRGIQSFLPIHASMIATSTTSSIRDQLIKMLVEELGVLDKLFEYGKLRSYLEEFPAYRT